MSRPIFSSPRTASPTMDPPSDQWELVIKVKYGDTLRRICAYFHRQLMDHNMAKLRAKIISLFKFNPDVDFVLTYTDEDGDLVTLDDDDELRDAVIGQHLNPLRITVQLKSNTSVGTDAATQSDSAILASAKSSTSAPPVNIHFAVDEALKAVPEPLRSALSDLSNDVLKIATPQPAFAQFVDYFSKLGLANVCSNVTTCKSSGGASGVSAHLVDLNISEEPKGSDVPIHESNTTLAATPAPKQQEFVNVVQAVGTVDSGSPNLDQDVPKNKNVSPYASDDLSASIWTTIKCLESEKEGDNARSDGKVAVTSAPFSWLPVSNHLEPQSFPIYGGCPDVITDMTTKLPASSLSHATQIGVDYHCDGPMSRQIAPLPPFYNWHSGVHPYERFHSYHVDTPQIFHRGVQCDICGMHPIVGSRYKSKVKDDYDLCNFCFSTTDNNEADFMRFDRAVHMTPILSREFPIFHSMHPFPSSNASHSCCGRPPSVKLESRFIQDVTVSDGTMMPPSSHFTKIWRMRNIGTVAWPFGTQLVWVGGDRLGKCVPVELEIPENGFPVECELDIAVDFVAPSQPGRYVSYWRLASSSGQKFGQQVWVLIQVDHCTATSPHPELNLNLPPESNNGWTGVGIIDVNVEPVDNGPSESSSTCTTEESVKSAEFPASGRMEYPAQADEVVPPTLSSFFDIPSAEVPSADGNQVEYVLLKELEDMGFRQIDLNKEILRQNDYDLEQSVDDLCVYAECDPLLDQLQIMGFADKELNKRLLVKNGGSIKHAVLDLINGEKSQ